MDTVVETPEDQVSTLEGLVERLKVVSAELGQALTDDFSEVTQFCRTLEAILRHLQKDKVSFWGERRDYWHYLSEEVGGVKSLGGITKQVQAIPQLITGQGRGRALLRTCLSHHLLADCLQNSVSSTKRTKEWYHPGAILLSPSLSQRVISALYDLTDMTFDLPSDGLDLDETWPSFVLKSFRSPEHGKHSLLQALSTSSTKDATVADHTSPRCGGLERAVEEHPTEIFVRQEVPFDLDLVSTLMNEISRNLSAQSSGHASLPPLTISTLDDVSSCLMMMRDYAVMCGQEGALRRGGLEGQLATMREHVVDLELQLEDTLQESESSENSLLSHLNDSRQNLQSNAARLQRARASNSSLEHEVLCSRERVTELEALNFSLEEKLIELELKLEEKEGGEEEEERPSSRTEATDGGERRRRGFTRVEAVFAAKDREISELTEELQTMRMEGARLEAKGAGLRSRLDTAERALAEALASVPLLQNQLARECEARATVGQRLLALHDAHSELRRSHEVCARAAEEARGEAKMQGEAVVVMEARCRQLEGERDAGREEAKAMEVALAALRGKLEREAGLRTNMERERDVVTEELQSMHGVVEHETQSLKYQLSSQAMELQQARESMRDTEQRLALSTSELSKVRTELDEAKQRYRESEEQLSELRQELEDVEGILRSSQLEMTSLNEQLTEKTFNRDSERADLLQLQNELDASNLRLYCEKQEFGKQLRNIGDENAELRRAFKGLLQQKVTLWKHADDLEQEQLSRGEWLESRLVLECMGCSSIFSVFTRKHHCRSCGKVFCTACCAKKAQLPFSKAPVRVCNTCDEKISQLRTPLASKFVNSLEDTQRPESPSVTNGSGSSSPGDHSPSLHRPSSTISIERSGNSLHAKLLVQNADEVLSSSFDTMTDTSTASPGSAIAMGGGVAGLLDAASFKSYTSTDYSIDPEVKRKEQEREREREEEEEKAFYNIRAVEGDSSDDSYYLISTKDKDSEFPIGLDVPGNAQLDVDALAEKLASLEPSTVAELSGGEVRSPAYSQAAAGAVGGRKIEGAGVGSSEFVEVHLEGGAEHRVPVSVEQMGSVVAWQFSTQPKGIAFGISFAATQGRKEEEVLPLRRCMSHKATLNGEYVAQKRGEYVLRFDNCHSKFAGRTLSYKIWLKRAL